MEKALALIETILAFWLAYPASIAFGKVLLQTAPPQDAIPSLALKKAIREVESHPSVTRVSRPHIWQLTPHSPSHKSAQVTPTRPRPISRATSHYNRRERSEKSGDWSDSAGSSILVSNIVVHLRADVESGKVIEVTRMAYEAFDNALGSRRCGHKWAMRGGELSVMVMRGERKAVEAARNHHHHHHDHGHGHGHEHGADHHHHHSDGHVKGDAAHHKTNGHSHDSHQEFSSAHTHKTIHNHKCDHGHGHQY